MCVYVSNHGGRQLDHGRGAMEVLPEVVQAVRGRATVMVDGGFSRGTDIVKAIALGADAVGVGRLYCYGLAADGASACGAMLELLEHEIGVDLGAARRHRPRRAEPELPAPRRAGDGAACAQRLSPHRPLRRQAPAR